MNLALRRARKAKGLTQVQLAIDARVSINTIRNAEFGLPVTDATKRKIASALEVPVSTIFRSRR